MRLIRYAIRFARGPLTLAACIGLLAGVTTVATLTVIASALRGHDLTRSALAFAALIVLGPALRFAAAEILTRFSARQFKELGERLSRCAVDSDLRSVERVGSHRLMATLTQDVGAVATALTTVPMLIVNTAIAIGCVAYLAVLSPLVFVMVLITTIVAIGLHIVVTRSAAGSLRSARREQDVLVGYFRALTDGYGELKLHRGRREAFLSSALVAALTNIARLKVESFGIFNRSASYQQAMFLLALGAGVFGGRLLNADMGTVGGVVLTLFYMRSAVEGLVVSVPTIQQADVALRNFHDVMGLLPREQDAVPAGAAGPEPALARFERLEIKGVEYVYDETAGERFHLGPVTMTLKPGELVFVTGGNGSGKTTLAKLIAGLYAPTAGSLVVNGETVDRQHRDRYRQVVTCVLSDFHLFRELLGLARPTLDVEATQWLRRLHLEERVSVSAGVFSTIDVSAGQRKRLALLVAMLEDRPVCIFDEWAADQDSQYRQEFYAHILPALRADGKLVIVISHDDRYYSIADRLIKMEEGRVVCDEHIALTTAASSPAPAPALVSSVVT